MGMLPFLLVLYSTFLTRSGVLGDTSVHSFETPGMWVYILLVALIGFFLLLGLGLYFWRVREIPKQKIHYTLTSREFALFLGAGSLIVVAGFTLIGTSAPLITNILKGQASAIDTSFYLKTNLPLAILMAAMIGLGQLFWWKKSNSQTLLRTMQLPSTAATILTLIVIFAGMHDILMILFFLASAFALFVNLEIAYKIAKGNPRFMGASVAHIGVSLLFIGIIASARYDQHVTLSLPLGESRDAFGYKLTYVGTSQVDQEKTAYDVTVANGASEFNAPLVMYASEYNGGAIMRHPYIFSLVNYDIFSHPSLLAFIGENMLTRDLYLSPQALEEENAGGVEASQYGVQVALNLNEPVKLGKYTMVFEGFQVPADQNQAMQDGKAFELASIIELTTPDGKIETIMPSDMIVPGSQNQLNTLKTKSGDQFTVTDIHVDDKTKQASVMIGYMPASNSPDISLLAQAQRGAQNKKEVLVIEATIKPFINLVWGGVIIMVIGFIITWRRRREELARMHT